MKNNQEGFSLIELLLVAVIIMVLSSIAVPYLMSAVGAAENGNAYASLKTFSAAQVNYYTANGRYARLDELNTAENNRLGTTVGNEVVRGIYTFAMSPAAPTDTELRENFTVIASKASNYHNQPYVISLDASGQITEIFP
ncbi:MAG: prepilin-type N-terminal cleavage/methylation domain-containing protein [Aridibacter famidurans]|nr:prepilin-type N-terminal cleavage/methylation domain-containing protein [Aridibacter famidurans]